MPPKEEKKPESPPGILALFSHPDPFVQFVFVIVGILVIIYLINAFLAMLLVNVGSPASVWDVFLSFFMGNSFQIWIIRILLAIFSIILAVVVVDTHRKLVVLRKEEKARLYPDIVPEAAAVNPEWKRIVSHSESQNENDWRQAIIEADIMLAGALEKMGLPGDTVGDKLKAMGNNYITDKAWEAHRIRNQIAHDGPAFVLTQRQARETITQYETVLKEFKII